MKILIIGGTGVLSSAVVKEALRKNHDIYMINRGNNMKQIPSNAVLYKADYHDSDKVKTFLKDKTFDVVIDFLCYNKEQIKYSLDLFGNITKQYIFISSCAVYNTKECSFCTEESPKVLDIWQYSVEKVECENLLISECKTKGINYTIIRPSVTYGDTRIPYGISPKYGYHWTLIARILNNKPIITWNNGINKCNIMHVDDFAVGLVGLFGNPKAINEAFNVCGDETPSWNDVLDCISSILGKQIIRFNISPELYAKEIPWRKGEIIGGRSIDAINSNKKIKEAVPEFKCSITLKEGIQRTINAYKAQNYQKGIDWEFDAQTDRIIAKYSKGKKYNTSFVNYLHESPTKCKKSYYKAYYSRNILFRITRKIFKVLR